MIFDGMCKISLPAAPGAYFDLELHCKTTPSKISLPAAPGAYFDLFCMCLAICVPEVPWEVGVGGRWEGQTTRIFLSTRRKSDESILKKIFTTYDFKPRVLAMLSPWCLRA